jgi:predicted nucleic acid-binding protein
MIILDTNVISALMGQPNNQKVINWLNHQRASDIWITAISLYELEFGIYLLPAGRKRTELMERVKQVVEIDLTNRVLPFDSRAARETAKLAAQRHQARTSQISPDTMISGVAIANRSAIATRNVRHFEMLSVAVINPWEA